VGVVNPIEFFLDYWNFFISSRPLKGVLLFMGNPSQSYGASPAI